METDPVSGKKRKHQEQELIADAAARDDSHLPLDGTDSAAAAIKRPRLEAAEESKTDERDGEAAVVLVGFSGLAGSGKSTATARLVEAHGASSAMLAGPLKRLLVDFYGLPVEYVVDPLKKDALYEPLGVTPRELMQKVGMLFRRLGELLPKMRLSAGKGNLWLELVDRFFQHAVLDFPCSGVVDDDLADAAAALVPIDAVVVRLLGIDPYFASSTSKRVDIVPEWGVSVDEVGQVLETLLRLDILRELPALKVPEDIAWSAVATAADPQGVRRPPGAAAALCGKKKIVVVSDVRFPDEVEWVSRHGGRVVRLERPQEPDSISSGARTQEATAAHLHASERGCACDLIVPNAGSLGDLWVHIDSLVPGSSATSSVAGGADFPPYSEAAVIMRCAC